MFKKTLCLLFCVIMTVYCFAGCKTDDEIFASDMPVIKITTEDNAAINSKEDYVNSRITLSNVSDEIAFSNLSAGIRGRGNFTWTLDKKPYRIKFDEKNKMFGGYAAKSWTLIANHSDNSLLKNYLALYLARSLDGMDWNSNATFAEVYLNDEYLGVYIVCDQIQVDENRINVETETTNVDTGFLIEQDRYVPDEGGTENVDYFLLNGTPYAVKTPETSDKNFSIDKIAFIKNYVKQVNSAIHAKDLEAVQSLCDIDSIIDFYIHGQIIAGNEFNGGSSFYMHKNAGGKLKFGPAWDFDISLGFRNKNLHTAYNGEDYTTILNDNAWFNKLWDISEFRAMFAARFNQVHDKLDDLVAEMDRVQQKYSVAFNNNFIKWDINDKLWFEPDATKNFETQKQYYDFTRDFLVKRINHFKTMFSE